MDTRATRDLPASLERVQQRFERWRQTRTIPSPIPDRLWAAAVRMVGRYGLCRTARTLRLDYYSLKKRAEAVSAAEHDETTPGNADQYSASAPQRCLAGTNVLRTAGAEDGMQATFVELPSFAHTASGECILELENATGAKMRIQFKGVAMPDLTVLTRGFWDRGP